MTMTGKGWGSCALLNMFSIRSPGDALEWSSSPLRHVAVIWYDQGWNQNPRPHNHCHCEKKRIDEKRSCPKVSSLAMNKVMWANDIYSYYRIVHSPQHLDGNGLARGHDAFLNIFVMPDHLMKFCLHFFVLSLPACSLALPWWGCSLAGDTMAKSGSGFGRLGVKHAAVPSQPPSLHRAAQ